MKISSDTIKAIKGVDILNVITPHVTMRKLGRHQIGPCPFHKTKIHSFRVSQEKQIYQCFVCGEVGDSIKFIMDFKGLGYADALLYLSKNFNLDVEYEDDYSDNEIFNSTEEQLDEILRSQGYDPEKLKEDGIRLVQLLKSKLCQSNIKATDVSTSADTGTIQTSEE